VGARPHLGAAGRRADGPGRGRTSTAAHDMGQSHHAGCTVDARRHLKWAAM